MSNKNRWILVLNIQTDGSDFVLINIYSASTEKQPICVLIKITILSTLKTLTTIILNLLVI